MKNETFLVQTIKELMREETLPDLILANNDHYMLSSGSGEEKTAQKKRKKIPKIRTMVQRKVHFGDCSVLLARIPSKTVLKRNRFRRVS